MVKNLLLSLFALIMLSACDQKALFEKFVPQEETKFSKEYLALFRARNYEAIETKINPAVKDVALRSKLEQIAALFPQEEPKEVAVVGSHVVNTQSSQQTNLSLQYEFSNKWLLASVALQRSGDAFVVNGVNVQPLKDSLENTNRFTFEGKGVSNYVVFTWAILVPLFIISALILCIKTPISKRKWLWIVFVLLGFVQVTLNWTTGEVSVNPISFQLLGAGFWKAGPYAPLLITASVPLGAVLFLLKRMCGGWAKPT